jgi:hypothetical protein
MAWDLGGKFEIDRSNTDNVNLNGSNHIKDSYNNFSGYLQYKNDTYKIKLKGKKEHYNNQQNNDNSLVDLSLQFRRSDYDDYTLGIFKQVYDGATIVSTDTTSDNLGGRLGATFSKDFLGNTFGYLTLNASVRRYPKIAGRSDHVFGSLVGGEYNPTSYLVINPELYLQKNSSAVPYYSHLAYGPTLTITVSPIERWELFVVGSYAKTNYSGRVYSVTNAEGIPISENETQALVSVDYGTSYKFNKKVSIEGRYSHGKNNSNNPASMYDVNVLTLSFSLKI